MDNSFDKDQKINDLKEAFLVFEDIKKTEEEKEETPKVEAKPKPEVNVSKPKDENTVAIFAEGNIYQAKWGELSKGYNIIKKEAADFWLAHRTVRLATPEEVAKHYGIK